MSRKGTVKKDRREMMKKKSIGLQALTVVALLSGVAQGEVLVDFDAATDVLVSGANFNADFALNTVVPTVTADGANYIGEDVYGAMNERNIGLWTVGNNGASGLRVRMNNTANNGVDGLFLFKINGASFEAGADTLNAASIYTSSIELLDSATIRFVVEDAGQFYISEASPELVTGGTGGQTDSYSTNALTANWFNYDPVSAATNVSVIGSVATPAFTDIDFIGFALFADGKAGGAVNAGSNYGVRQFSATGIAGEDPGPDPWEKLEYFDFETDAAGAAFGPNWVNSGSLGSRWNFGGPTTIAADGAGSLVASNHPGTVTRKLPKKGTANAAVAADQYAAPLTNGQYRLELDFNGWNLDGSATVNKSMNLQLRPTEASGSVAGINLKLQDATTVRVQMFSDLSAMGNQNGFRNYDFPLTNSSPLSFAIVFDYENSSVEYYTNGVLTESFNDFSGTEIGTLQFSTASGWSSNHLVSIEQMGFSRFNEAVVPLLAVDFNASDITNNVQHEYVDFSLNLDGAPQLTTPDYLGQPIYAGLKLDPVNGKVTGDDGGAYTNGGAISFGKNGSGAKLQWNGAQGGDDTGRYEEDDVATAVFMFKKSDFLDGLDSGTVFMASSNDTLSATVRLDAKSPARLKSGKFRWVVQDAGSYYISAEVTNLTSDTGNVELTGEAKELSWFDYDPETSATSILAAASPELLDIDALGFWMSATILTNTGVRVYPNMQCSDFEAQAGVIPVEGPVGQWEDWLGDYDLGTATNFQDDADGDWVDNLSEYAFGGNPADETDQGNTPAEAQVSEGGTNYLVYVYFEREDALARGLSSSVEVGTGLVITNWGINTAEFVGSGASGIEGFNAVTNRIPTDTEIKQFIRLQIEFTP